MLFSLSFQNGERKKNPSHLLSLLYIASLSCVALQTTQASNGMPCYELWKHQTANFAHLGFKPNSDFKPIHAFTYILQHTHTFANAVSLMLNSKLVCARMWKQNVVCANDILASINKYLANNHEIVNFSSYEKVIMDLNIRSVSMILKWIRELFIQ